MNPESTGFHPFSLKSNTIMKMISKYPFICLMTIVFFFASCDNDDPEIPNEEELITTLIYTLTPVGGGSIQTMIFQDLDGEGGNAPLVSGAALEVNKSYKASIVLTNELANPSEDITAEVRAEGDAHQFFFESQSNLDLQVSYDDTDINNNPIGLNSIVQSGQASSGQLKITLRHEPEKNASGVALGDITNAGGETDIEVTFEITIE
jgi:hypothetical protein